MCSVHYLLYSQVQATFKYDECRINQQAVVHGIAMRRYGNDRAISPPIIGRGYRTPPCGFGHGDDHMIAENPDL